MKHKFYVVTVKLTYASKVDFENKEDWLDEGAVSHEVLKEEIVEEEW